MAKAHNSGLSPRGMVIGAVALVDVLGWKGIWQRRPNALADIHKLIKQAELDARLLVSKEMVGSTKNRFNDIKIRVVSISDTVAITAVGGILESVEIVALVATSLVSDALKMGLAMRGAISFGKFSLKNNILVGPAVDEVASWYEEAEWIGLHLTPSAMLEFDVKKSFIPGAFLTYDLPLKHGSLKKGIVCNWLEDWTEKNSQEKLLEFKKMLVSMGPITSDIAPKLLNTQHFVEYYITLLAQKVQS